MVSSSIAQLAETLAPWLQTDGCDGDVVISSRVRIARNLRGRRFPLQKDLREERHQIFSEVSQVAESVMEVPKDLRLSVEELTDADYRLLEERRLVSRELLQTHRDGGVLITPDQQLSLMINEEDHLRGQVVRAGLNLSEPYQSLSEIMAGIERELPFAFDRELGYLTACPTNVGTGLRVSVMLHLPALVFCNHEEKIIRAADAMGLAVRGLFGEGSEPEGMLFQVSNQSTLGEDEQTICRRLERVVRQLIMAERSSRRYLMRKETLRLADYVARAFSGLKFARLISCREAFDKLFTLRFGILMGMFSVDVYDPLHELLQGIQSEHLQLFMGRELDNSESAAARSVLIRRKLTYI